jgi:hypothetical protein
VSEYESESKEEQQRQQAAGKDYLDGIVGEKPRYDSDGESKQGKSCAGEASYHVATSLSLRAIPWFTVDRRVENAQNPASLCLALGAIPESRSNP